jgi:hypothetical protein
MYHTYKYCENNYGFYANINKTTKLHTSSTDNPRAKKLNTLLT